MQTELRSLYRQRRFYVIVFLLAGSIFGFGFLDPLAESGHAAGWSQGGGVFDQADPEPIVFDDFQFLEGVEIAFRDWRRVVQLAEGSTEGRAETYFFDRSGQYDITLFYLDTSDAKSTVDILINNRSIGEILFGSSGSSKEKTISGVDVQQWSRIELRFAGGIDSRCPVESLALTHTGEFKGKTAQLARPLTLDVFETSREQKMARNIYSEFVATHLDRLFEQRMLELMSLKDPADWRARQRKTRSQLARFLGEFPEKTPLNARTVAKLDRERYTIEKVIFESQPAYYVSANLYLPKDLIFPVPGVISPCGHSDLGKAAESFQKTALGLVRKGYVVLVLDPVGQGERSEYFDPQTKEPTVALSVDQHHYVGWPALLVNWTLSGLRTWDCIRAVDYLVSRPEVDENRLAAVGCSGGGQMTLLITAVDERIKVGAASHPGGSMENTFLLGRSYVDREILSLIPPRPLRMIVGNESGEEPNHRKKLEDMQLFYEGLRAGRSSGDMDVVPGRHSMNRSNRQSAYEWINKWLDKESEGKAEAELQAETVEELWCTESGHTLATLGGETGQTLNAKRVDQIYQPEQDLARLRQRIARRIRLNIPRNYQVPRVQSGETVSREGISIEKMTYQSEKGILVPALLITPESVKPNSPVYVHFSDKGKPRRIEKSLTPFLLADSGSIVLSLDVRGMGETSPTPSLVCNRFTGYTPLKFRHDTLAIESTGFGRTTLGMRTLDVIRGVDFLGSLDELEGKNIVLVGEGLGGLWALLAAVYDPRVSGVVTIGTLPSYQLLVKSKYYSQWGYFWTPGVLCDFDIPDLARLIAPRPQVWVYPVNALGERIDFANASSVFGSHENLQILTGDLRDPAEMVQLFESYF